MHICRERGNDQLVQVRGRYRKRAWSQVAAGGTKAALLSLRRQRALLIERPRAPKSPLPDLQSTIPSVVRALAKQTCQTLRPVNS